MVIFDSHASISNYLYAPSLIFFLLILLIADEGNREFRKEEEQESHSLCQMWPSQFPHPEEPLLRLRLPRRSQEDLYASLSHFSLSYSFRFREMDLFLFRFVFELISLILRQNCCFFD